MADQTNANNPGPTTSDPSGAPPATAEPQPAAAGGPAAGPSASTAASDPTAELRAERDRLKDGLLRSMADLDNFRKRARRDADEAARKAREDTLRELLPVFDNLERAARYMETGADPTAVAKGIEMVLRLFEDTLVKLGGKRVVALGQPFDPAQHEAIQQIESADHPAGTVAREELAGYLFNDRLLRPAMVVVSRGPGGGGTGGAAGPAS